MNIIFFNTCIFNMSIFISEYRLKSIVKNYNNNLQKQKTTY